MQYLHRIPSYSHHHNIVEDKNQKDLLRFQNRYQGVSQEPKHEQMKCQEVESKRQQQRRKY